MDIAALYFHLGLSYQNILRALAVNHRRVISMRTLKRWLSHQNLFRRKNYSNVVDVAVFINEQLKESGELHGYRWMHLKCIQAGLSIPRRVVHTLLQILDPDGVNVRRKGRLRRRAYFAKGPNYLWHLDSYDKLKPFGLCINGCIDGFSRQLIWLNVHSTSSDPLVIGGYYIEVINSLKGCPFMIRGDMGTENGHVARMQEVLSRKDSFLYGKSVHNQRIESFWGILRKECAQFWIETFTALKNGSFTGDFIDKSLVQFCFTDVVKKDLARVVSVWNSHNIRRTKNENVPHGRPVVMYTVPELYETRDYLIATEQVDIDACYNTCKFRDGIPCDPEMYELLTILMVEHRLETPVDVQAALNLYHTLRPLVLQGFNSI